jgi:hypothetical protein
MTRAIGAFVSDISAGLVSLEELELFLFADEASQIMACKDLNLNVSVVMSSALRLCSTYIKSYPSLGRKLEDCIRNRYFHIDTSSIYFTPQIVFYAARSLSFMVQIDDCDRLDQMSHSASWRDRILAAFVLNQISLDSLPRLQEIRINLSQDPYSTPDGHYLVRLALGMTP